MSTDTGFKYRQFTQFITKHQLIYLSQLWMIVSTVPLVENNIASIFNSWLSRIMEAGTVQMDTLYLEPQFLCYLCRAS